MLNHRSSKALCALVSALALAGFSGCGDDDEEKSAGATTEETTSSSSSDGAVDAYKKEFEAAGTDFRDAAKDSATDVQGATDTAGRVKALEGLKGVVTDAADSFEGLDPPAEVQADNDKLVSQFRSVAEQVDAVKNALQSEDQPAAQAAAQRLQRAQTTIGKTLTSIESKVGN
jgi:hypothetical protein